VFALYDAARWGRDGRHAESAAARRGGRGGGCAVALQAGRL